jgi:hypothetical protein
MTSGPRGGSRRARVARSLVIKTLRSPFTRQAFIVATRSTLLPRTLRHRLGRVERSALLEDPRLEEGLRTGKVIIIYHSTTGNTEKVAQAVERGIRAGGVVPTVKKVGEALKEDLYDYDLVCLGSPVVHSLPPAPVMRYLHAKGKEYRERGDVRLPAREIPGKRAIIFITYSGPHIGIDEATPAGKYLSQFLEHLGFEVQDEIYVVGEFHSWRRASTNGFLGDIRGRPNREDLATVETRIAGIAHELALRRDSRTRIR